MFSRRRASEPYLHVMAPGKTDELVAVMVRAPEDPGVNRQLLQGRALEVPLHAGIVKAHG